LEEKVAALVSKTENIAAGIPCADQAAPYIHKKLALTLSTSGGRSVGILRLQTQATKLFTDIQGVSKRALQLQKLI
jgi:hypothetical protein